jgi:hypothetical protein
MGSANRCAKSRPSVTSKSDSGTTHDITSLSPFPARRIPQVGLSFPGRFRSPVRIRSAPFDIWRNLLRAIRDRRFRKAASRACSSSHCDRRLDLFNAGSGGRREDDDQLSSEKGFEPYPPRRRYSFRFQRRCMADVHRVLEGEVTRGGSHLDQTAAHHREFLQFRRRGMVVWAASGVERGRKR